MNKIVTFKKLAVIALILLAAPFFTAKAAEKNLIVGGKRVGQVILGDSASKYESFLGPRTAVSSTFFDYPKRKMALLVKDGVINGIMVYSPQYQTAEGVRVGAPASILLKRYGQYLKTESGSLVYSELGLAFIEKDGRISRIMVVQASPDTLLGDKMVVPGVRAGGIKIGMDINMVEKYWGQPTSQNVLESNKSVMVYNYTTKAVKLLVTEGIISGAQINSYKYQTQEGIGINSTREQVIKTYGSRYNEVKGSIMYNSLGIGFYFNEGKVIEILLTFRKE